MLDSWGRNSFGIILPNSSRNTVSGFSPTSRHTIETPDKHPATAPPSWFIETIKISIYFVQHGLILHDTSIGTLVTNLSAASIMQVRVMAAMSGIKLAGPTGVTSSCTMSGI